ncbi:hypothetical protein GGI02_002851 [Coemansia sp. RSA 2322]|nr:hypothetical protein GGI02_002851 [Coemansia sp. RSA 2322]
MAGPENDLTELFIRNFKCTGDVPPALVGSSATYVGGHAYVFGGRALHSGKLSSDMYVCDLGTFAWRRVNAGGQQPAARFFHSATAFRQFLVVFGGMGLDGDDSGSIISASVNGAAGGSIHDGQQQQQQSFQMRASKTLLGDVAVYDTRAEQWVALDALRDPELDGIETGGDSAPSQAPSPRYAHLATVLGSRLLVVGGQDLEEQYVEELNVLDLATGRWTQRAAFPRAVGLYRSFIGSVPSTGATLVYSNYSFAAVKRALYALTSPPECALHELSEQLTGEPPGLRFPRGHVVDPHTVVMTGTLIAGDGHSEVALWALDAKNLRWTPLPCGARFRTGSWNQSVVDARSNSLVLFGDSRRDLTYDYQRRRLNYAEARSVDLRALGYVRGTGGVPNRVGGLAPDIGAQFMSYSQFADAELVASDGTPTPVNSGLLRARWPVQAHMWLIASEQQRAQNYYVRGSSGNGGSDDDSGPDEPRAMMAPGRRGRPESSVLSGSGTGDSMHGVSARRFAVDASRDAVAVLLLYLYTERIDATAARLGSLPASSAGPAGDVLAAARVLGEVLGVARRCAMHRLALRLVSQLRAMVSEFSAPVIYEAALRAEHRGLQARCVLALRDCIAKLRSDRRSSLYMISNASRASLIRFFPRLDSSSVSDDSYAAASSSSSPDARMRSPSDAATTSAAAFSNSPRRPWDPVAMSSPLVYSPASTRYSAAQSPDLTQQVRSSPAPSASAATTTNALTNRLPPVSQPLPEDSVVDYADSGFPPPPAASSVASAASSPADRRMSRYMMPPADHQADRRPSDSTISDQSIAPQQQQQQQPQSSARSMLFRPWSKMKKIASSSQVSTDSLPPMPSHASSFSGHSN